MTHSKRMNLAPRLAARAAAVIVLLSAASAIAGDLITSGPMVGHVSDSEASIWLRAESGASISALASEGQGKPYSPTKIEDIGDGFWIVHFATSPASAITAEVTATKPGAQGLKTVVSFRTAPRPSKTGKVRLAFGSCSKLSKNPEGKVYKAIAAEAPDFALFVGDNSYFIVGDGDFGTSGPKGDWTSPELMLARHLETRNFPDLTRMLRTVPCYAVWDDHDYGPNNADRTFERKSDALRIFKQVWANPSYGEGPETGIYSSFRYGPVEVFLLDDRWYKYVHDNHPEVSEEAGTIWGEAQMKWLMAGLKASTAPVKLIANGTQVISEAQGGEGHGPEAKLERRKLLDFLKESKIGGVVFLTGDRHYTESMALRQEGAADILEFTSSPMAQGDKVGPLEGRHATRLWGMRGDSYGLVTVEIPEEGKGMVRFEARDERNRVPILSAERCVTNWELRKLNY